MSVTKDTAIRALNYVSSNDRDIWVRMGMALKSEYGDGGLNIWLDWSSRSPKFNRRVAVAQWRSFKTTGGVRIGSLLYEAKQNGWNGVMSSDDRMRTEKERLREQEEWEARERAARIKRQREAAIAAAGAIKIANSGEVEMDHPYMIEKGLEGVGVIVLNKTVHIHKRGHKVREAPKGSIVVPIFNEKGKMIANQLISATGNKLFVPDGCSVQDGRYTVGHHGKAKDVWLCEGFATGISIWKVMREHLYEDDTTIVVCFSKHNMMRIAIERTTYRYHHTSIMKPIHVIMDNDTTEFRPDPYGMIKNKDMRRVMRNLKNRVHLHVPPRPGDDANDMFVRDPESLAVALVHWRQNLTLGASNL